MLFDLGPLTGWSTVFLVIVLLVISAYFSSTEIAIFSLPDDWPSSSDRSEPQATALAQLRSDPHRLLVTLLVGNNLVNIAISSITTATIIMHVPGRLAVPLATLIASLLVLVFGEILPKAYGLGNAKSWSLTAARPLIAIGVMLSPLVIAFDFVTRRAIGLVGGDIHIEAPYTDA